MHLAQPLPDAFVVRMRPRKATPVVVTSAALLIGLVWLQVSGHAVGGFVNALSGVVLAAALIWMPIYTVRNNWAAVTTDEVLVRRPGTWPRVRAAPRADVGRIERKRAAYEVQASDRSVLLWMSRSVFDDDQVVDLARRLGVECL